MLDLSRAEVCGRTAARIFEQERHVTYAVTIARLRAKGFALDRGGGQQIALALGHCRVVAGRPEPSQVLQLLLLGGRP